MSTAKAAVVNANEISWDSLFPGDGLEDSCHRRRNQLETCIKKQKKSEQKTLFHFSVVNLETNVTLWEIFRKILVRTSTAHRWRSSKKKPCPQHEKEQMQPPRTTFSDLSDKISVPRGHDLFFHFSNMHQTHARARNGSKTRLRHFLTEMPYPSKTFKTQQGT